MKEGKKMKGGYHLLDATGVDLSKSTAQTVAGSWKKAQDAIASGKPLVMCNAIYGTGVPVSPVPGFGWYISSTEIVLVGATLHVHVKNTDKVTVVDVVPST